MDRSWHEAKEINPEIEEELLSLDEMNGRELMDFIMKADPETGIAMMVEEGAFEPVNEDQLAQNYDDVLREEYEPYQLEGCSFTPAEVLKQMAPDAYEKGFNDYTEDWVDLGVEFPGSQMDGMYMEIGPFFNCKKMDSPNDEATNALRADILERRPDLIAERQAIELSGQAKKMPWSPSQADADQFIPARGVDQVQSERQSRRL